ncbi:2-amino-4-hydroxy-6-hydroxymethyldihydropteridine diphosphokinase [Candidatus Margulisiibacteriota bacterium]
MPEAYIGLGSNMTDRKNNLLSAIALLEKDPDLQLLEKSSLLETTPEGKTDQADFLNMVIKIKTSHSPQALLSSLLAIEQELGRVRKEKWGPRTIDLDILLFDDKIISTQELTIPHPFLAKRKFILRSLVELCPNRQHPVLKKTMLELNQELENY